MRLAREARCEAIHSAGVTGWIEQPNVFFMHAQVGEPSVGGSLTQDPAAVGIKFNCSDWLVAKDEVGEQSAASTGEEVEGSHFTPRPPPPAAHTPGLSRSVLVRHSSMQDKPPAPPRRYRRSA